MNPWSVNPSLQSMSMTSQTDQRKSPLLIVFAVCVCTELGAALTHAVQSPTLAYV